MVRRMKRCALAKRSCFHRTADSCVSSLCILHCKQNSNFSISCCILVVLFLYFRKKEIAWIPVCTLSPNLVLST